MVPASASCSSSAHLALLVQDLAPLKSQSCFLWVKSAWSHEHPVHHLTLLIPGVQSHSGRGLAQLYSSPGMFTLLLCGLAASGEVLVKVSPRLVQERSERGATRPGGALH